MSKIRNRKSKIPGRFDLEVLCQSPQLAKTFKVESSRTFTLPVAYFAHIIDFCSYVDSTMSLYIQHQKYIYFPLLGGYYVLIRLLSHLHRCDDGHSQISVGS